MLNQAGVEIKHYYPQKVCMESAKGAEVHLRFTDRSGETFQGHLTVLASGAIRIRLFQREYRTPDYDIVNEAVLAPGAVTILEDETHLRIQFPGGELVMQKEPFSFVVWNRRDRLVYEENMKDVNSVGDGLDQIPPLGFTKSSTGAVAEINLAPRLHMDEHIYGLGEHFTEFDKRGQTIRMRNTDTLGCRNELAYKNIPFYISSYGYGLFVNDYGIYDFEIGSHSTASISIRVRADQLEYYLIPGKDLKQILSIYMMLTGPAALPPDWSFGLWYSTGFKGSSRDNVEADAAMFKKQEIPCSVLHFDCYWLRENMWCDFVWDDTQYPDRVQMLKKLKEDGFRICLWINPYVTEIAQMFEEGRTKGYLVKRADGSVYTADLWHGLLPYCGIVDFTNPEARRWYQQKAASVLREGVDVLKTDFAEDIPEDAVFYNGKTGKQMRNLYSMLYNEAVFSVIQKEKGSENGIVWARSGCAGMQKYPVCWSGDPYSSYEGMAATLRGGLSLAMSGVPFWSHDMGGFYGDVKEDVMIRWCQFGLFSSHSRLHGTTTRQPWVYGERCLKILKHFVELRYNLMPYILLSARECVSNGISFIRPLVLEHPDDPQVYPIYDQYYFGSRMLVCPVFGGDQAERCFYLPEGRWTDYLTGCVFEGKHWYTRRCALEYIPIFYKGDVRP